MVQAFDSACLMVVSNIPPLVSVYQSICSTAPRPLRGWGYKKKIRMWGSGYEDHVDIHGEGECIAGMKSKETCCVW